MPHRELKSRLLTREFFGDADLQEKHDSEQQLFYLFLAMAADDAGWLEWRPKELASVRWAFQNKEEREPRFEACAKALKLSGRLRVLRCGHAELPRVQPRGGRTEFSIRDEHLVGCIGKQPNAIGSKRSHSDAIAGPDRTGPILSGPSESTEAVQQRARRLVRRGAPLSAKQLLEEHGLSREIIEGASQRTVGRGKRA